MGVVAPFLLLLNKAVRRSQGWLLFAVSLVIFGVVLNRINVFLVAYSAPYSTRAYFPSIGEIAMTVAIVSSIMFCYRFVVTYFPILSGYTPPTEAQLARMREERALTVSPFWTWVIRGAAVAFLLGFIGLYNLVHTQAQQATVATVEEIRRVRAEIPVRAATPQVYPQRPEAYRNYYVLSSSVPGARADDYEPVLFSHRIHDGLTGGDCAACHHRQSADEKDRVGVDLKELHDQMGMKLGGACATCHNDMASNPPQSCARCHGLANEPDAPSRIGLKGAYHRQCIGCHERQPSLASAPTACASCHHPWTPEHEPLVTLVGKPGPQDVTNNCLTCHQKAGQDVLKSAHWNWKGGAPTVRGYDHRADVSLTMMASNACLTIGQSEQECATCHIGYGWTDTTFDFADPAAIDCLVCHDTTGTYRKVPGNGGRPDPSLDLIAIAKKVGRPSRQACGACHISGGSPPYARRGDLESALADPPADVDMHMGTLKMRCQDCHTTTDHRIAGMWTGAPFAAGAYRCEKCHGQNPHGVAGMLSRHLDDHVRAVACETCHIPAIATLSSTLVRRDYSKAGQDRPQAPDQHGMPTYDKRFGDLTWGRQIVPTYQWYNGTRTASLVGETIDPSSPVVLNAPSGERRDPSSRIHPFQVVAAVQPVRQREQDARLAEAAGWLLHRLRLVEGDRRGQQAGRTSVLGKYGFVETRLYSAVHHQVVPARKALGCSDCHSVEAITCSRCHRNAKGMDLPEHRRAVYPGVKNRIDFKALGYSDDPARVGGRFYVSFNRGTPPR